MCTNYLWLHDNADLLVNVRGLCVWSVAFVRLCGWAGGDLVGWGKGVLCACVPRVCGRLGCFVHVRLVCVDDWGMVTATEKAEGTGVACLRLLASRRLVFIQ